MERIAEVVLVQSLDREPVCPFCRDLLRTGDVARARCSRCGTAHHLRCWEENGQNCTVFHCNGDQRFQQSLPDGWLASLAAGVMITPALLLTVLPLHVIPDSMLLALLPLLALFVIYRK